MRNCVSLLAMLMVLSTAAIATASNDLSALMASRLGDCSVEIPSDQGALSCFDWALHDAVACRLEAREDCENANGTWDWECWDEAYDVWCLEMNEALDDFENCTGTEQECLDAYCDAVNEASFDLCEYLAAGWCCTKAEAVKPTPSGPLYNVHLQMTALGLDSRYDGR